MDNKLPSCDECKYLDCINGVLGKVFYCNNEERTEDMGRVNMGNPPKGSPHWCPKRRGGKGGVNMTNGNQSLGNNMLPDLYEKRLIIARYFINQKNSNKEFGEKEIYYMWNNYFPSDFRISKNKKLKLQLGKVYSKLVLLEDSADVSEKLINNYSNKWEKIHSWIVRYIKSHNLNDCDNDMIMLRHNQYKLLIKAYKPLGYYVRDTKEKSSSHRVSTYEVLQKQKSRSGSYAYLIKYLENYKAQ